MDEPQNEMPLASTEEVSTNSICPSCDEYLAGWKRAQADYQNLKKEGDRERMEFTKYAQESLLRDLLPAMDQYAIAMNYAPDTSTLPEDVRKTWEQWVIGLRAVRSLWDGVATSIGLERIPTTGTFDPLLHDAASEEEADGMASGTIVKVLQDGWRLHGKVLRPARVIIAK